MRPFVIASEGRTGSTMLVHALNTHSQITCYGELLNPSIGRRLDHNYTHYPNASTYLSDQVYRFDSGSRAVGMKLLTLQGRKPPIDDTRNYLKQIGVKVIQTRRRNYLKRYVSGAIGSRTGVWGLPKGQKSNPTERVRIDVPSFLEDMQNIQQRYRQTAEEFAGHDRLVVYYEDLDSDFSGQIERVQEFLGVDREPLEPQTQKQETRPLREIITNYEEVAQTLQETGYGEFLEG